MGVEMYYRKFLPKSTGLRVASILATALALQSGSAIAGTCTAISGVPQALSNGSYCLNFDVGVGGQPAFSLGSDAVLDCRGHRIHDLTGGTGSGIVATGHNITIKNCAVSGFREAIVVSGSNGYRILNNRVEGAPTTAKGISVYSSENGLISKNYILNIAPLRQHYWGIFVNSGTVDLTANTISNAIALPGSGASMYGIMSNNNNGGLVADNLLRNVIPDVGQQGISINVSYGRAILRNNMLINEKSGDISYFCYGGDFKTIDGVVLAAGSRLGC